MDIETLRHRPTEFIADTPPMESRTPPRAPMVHPGARGLA
jgi:hypothetical protein